MTNIKKFTVAFYFLLLASWISVSIVRTLNNLVKLGRDDVPLLLLDDNNLRRETYGQIYDFCSYVEKHTPLRVDILFLSSGAKPFYFCRYQLYPRQLFFARNPREASEMMKKRKYEYFLIYKSKDALEDENKSSTWNLGKYNIRSNYRSGGGEEGWLFRL